MDAIDAKRNNRYSVTSFLTTPIRSKITYYLYVGFCFGWVFPCSASQYRIIYNQNLCALRLSCKRLFLVLYPFTAFENALLSAYLFLPIRFCVVFGTTKVLRVKSKCNFSLSSGVCPITVPPCKGTHGDRVAGDNSTRLTQSVTIAIPSLRSLRSRHNQRHFSYCATSPA